MTQNGLLKRSESLVTNYVNKLFVSPYPSLFISKYCNGFVRDDQVLTNRDDEFTKNIREALLDDPQLMRLLGGTHVFEDTKSRPTTPHIVIGQSNILDWTGCRNVEGERTVSLQVWPRTCDKQLAQEFIDCAHRALEAAGLIGGKTLIRLSPEFTGSRRVPESKEYQGILRYHAIRQGEAA